MSKLNALDFLVRIAPELMQLGKDMFHLFEGDADAAHREITDRRADITRRRQENDEALKAKYKEGT